MHRFNMVQPHQVRYQVRYQSALHSPHAFAWQQVYLSVITGLGWYPISRHFTIQSNVPRYSIRYNDRLLYRKSYFQWRFTETLCTGVYFQWIASLRIKLNSRVLYTLQECKWGAHLPSLGRSACRWIYDRCCDARLVQCQTFPYALFQWTFHWK